MTSDEFSLTGPLPEPGTITLLEASAGTGKTHTMAALVARLVAAGHPLDEVLAVTFSRAATAELRDHIRRRLLGSRDAMACALAGKRTGDAVNLFLADAEPETLQRRLQLFDTALGQLDDAPIVTLHTFASRMLDELGLLADHDAGTHLAPDLEELADEVVADIYLGERPHGSPGGWASAHDLGRAAIASPFEELHPRNDPRARARVRFAEDVRAEFERRKRLRRVMSYDDMIGRLAATLADPVTGPTAAEVLAGRFRVVLVDEFQDTDPQQWDFLHRAFAGRSTMLLIGDPKQAIYRFRGGDIETYTRARDAATRTQRLATNYRSDAGVVDGVAQLFGDVDLGTSAAPIHMSPVAAAHTEPRLRREGTPLGEVVRVRAMRDTRSWQIPDVRAAIQRDVIAQVDLLLDGSHQILDPDEGNWRRVRPGDITILVNSNAFGSQLHKLLVGTGHPATFSGEASVFASPAARDWLRLLEAMESPDRWHLRRAMMTSLVGWTSADVAATEGDQMIAMTALLSRCARMLVDQGIAAVFETLVAQRSLYSRLLAQPDGEALLTDLRHVNELLNRAQGQHTGAAALVEFLRRAIDRAGTDSDERTRRLPTDRPVIKIMTIHQAKGLQFPIVLVPQASDRHLRDWDYDGPLIGHLDGRRILDVAPPEVRDPDHFDEYQAEEQAETLRTCYVACTRAQSLLVTWWAASQKNTRGSALHRLLLAARDGKPPAPTPKLCAAEELPRRRGVGLEVFDPPAQLPAPGAPEQRDQHLLGLRTFDDHIDRVWTRTSYTGLTAAVHGTPGGQPWLEHDEVEVAADQGTDPTAPVTSVDAEPAPVSALSDQPGGVQFGSLVHSVLEAVDPAAPDLQERLVEQVQRFATRFQLPGLNVDALVTGLVQTVTTPLGVLTDNRSLRDLGAANRLAELDFELPLGGPDDRRRRRVADLAKLFDALEPDDPLHRYGRLLGESAAGPTVLAGFLTGSIDVVLQVPGSTPRYVILDYKTNRVPTDHGEQLTARHYSARAMTAAMCEAHYPLQALLYGVALHRYLSWRLPGYQPDTHLGGVGYLFVRGMVGSDNPVPDDMPAGVFTWQPAAELVVAASDVLAGGR